MSIVRVGLAFVFTGGTVLASANLHAEESADGPRFEVRQYAVAGGTVFRPPEIDALLTPYVGTAVGFAEIEAARTALQAAYHRRGFGADASCTVQ